MAPDRTLPFHPHPLVRGGHLQTMAGLWLGSAVPYTAAQVTVPLEDGDAVVLHDDLPSGWSTGHRVALLVHGLAGCHGSGYMQRIAARLVERNVRAFRLDLRASGAGVPLARRPPHAGRYGDLLAAAKRVEALCPGAPIALVGFSLGGNVVLLATAALAATSQPTAIDRTIAVSPPVDLAACVASLRSPTGRLYDRYLTGQLRQRMAEWQRANMAAPRWEGDRPPQSIREFDERVTAPLSGFTSADDYYAHSSSGPRLAEISIPTRILAAADDPVVPQEVVAAAQLSPQVERWLTASGGHLGFVTRRRHAPRRRWLDQLIVDWVCDWQRPPAT